MAYDEDLADRLRVALQREDGVVEKRMFGGLAFLVGGHMAVAASGQGGLLVRVDPARSDTLVDGTSVRRMEMSGREMNGWLRVETPATDAELARWAALGVEFVRSLPPK